MQTYNIYHSWIFVTWVAMNWACRVGEFFLCGTMGTVDYVMTTLHSVVVWEYEIF